MKNLGALCFFLIIASSLSAQELRLRISGIKQGKGDMLVAVFNKEDGFPSETTKAVALLRAVPENGCAELIIKSLPSGRYAVAFFQDTNRDGVLNTNFIGMPKEGYGVSNNAFNAFSAPTYKEASFSFPQVSELTMSIKY